MASTEAHHQADERVVATKDRRDDDLYAAMARKLIDGGEPKEPSLKWHPATMTKEFRDWFGLSAVRELMVSSKQNLLDMAPKILYHATKEHFREFEVGRKAINTTTFGDIETERHAIFAAEDPNFAEGYGKGEGQVVMPVFMKIENPLDLTEGISGEDLAKILENDESQTIKRNDFHGLYADHMWQLFDGDFGKKIVAAAKKSGFDGVSMIESDPQTGDSQQVWAVFDAHQVKSVFDFRVSRQDEVKNQQIATSGAPGDFPLAQQVVDGLYVRDHVPNTSSISASLENYTLLNGVREIPISAFDQGYVASITRDRLDARTLSLADQIRESKEINPLIVAIDEEGPYILEGGHRFDALIANGSRSIPALVVLDDDSLVEADSQKETGIEFERWFSQSKVIDDRGAPLKVYHSGTFDPRFDREFNTENGVHFGTERAALERVSGKFVDGESKGAAVYEEDGRFYLDDNEWPEAPILGFLTEKDARLWVAGEANRLFDSSFVEDPIVTQAYLCIRNPKRVNDQGEDWSAAIAQARSEGYDGIVYRNEYEDKGSDSYIAFSPEQIMIINRDRNEDVETEKWQLRRMVNRA